MSSDAGSSVTVARVALAAAAVGAAAYAYYRLSRATAPPSGSSPPPAPGPLGDATADALAEELAEAYAEDAKNAETFAAQTPEEAAEMRRQAAVHMARLQAGGNLGADGSGGMKNLTPEECGGRSDAYRWSQTEQEIVVEFDVDPSVVSKRVVVQIDTKSVKMAVKSPGAAGDLERVILEGALLREVVPDECVWEMERADDGGKKVVVTLHKRRATLAMHHWNCVVKGEPVIDVEKFGPPVVGVDGNDPGAIARMLEDMGGPNDGGR